MSSASTFVGDTGAIPDTNPGMLRDGFSVQQIANALIWSLNCAREDERKAPGSPPYGNWHVAQPDAMLRITTVKTRKHLRLVLEGELASPWLTELAVEWSKVRATAGDLKVVVELKCVTMIREEGEHILLEMMTQGARIVTQGILNRYILRKLERRVGERGH